MNNSMSKQRDDYDAGPAFPDPPAGEDELLLMEYLDGALDATARRRVEERLAAETDLRIKMSVLERSWHALDLLERTGIDRKLAETTLETVIFSAENEMLASPEHLPKRRRSGFFSRSVLVVCFLLFGAWSVFHFVPDPNLLLLLDMPIIERFDRYRNILDDPRLLELLVEQRVFYNPATAPETQEPFADMALFEETASTSEEFSTRPSHAELHRRLDALKRLKTLDATRYAQFYRNYHTFTSLGEAQKQKYRDLNDVVRNAADPHAADATLTAFYLWFKSLPPYEKREFADASSVEQRLGLIRKIRARSPQRIMADDLLDSTDSPHDAELAAFLLRASPEERDHVLSLPPVAGLARLKNEYRSAHLSGPSLNNRRNNTP